MVYRTFSVQFVVQNFIGPRLDADLRFPAPISNTNMKLVRDMNHFTHGGLRLGCQDLVLTRYEFSQYLELSLRERRRLLKLHCQLSGRLVLSR